MDLRVAVQNLTERATDVMNRLRTDEANTLRRADLHILEVQIYLLDKEIKKVKATLMLDTVVQAPPFPPFKTAKQE
jgi:hypothetical protein